MEGTRVRGIRRGSGRGGDGADEGCDGRTTHGARPARGRQGGEDRLEWTGLRGGVRSSYSTGAGAGEPISMEGPKMWRILSVKASGENCRAHACRSDAWMPASIASKSRTAPASPSISSYNSPPKG